MIQLNFVSQYKYQQLIDVLIKARQRAYSIIIDMFQQTLKVLQQYQADKGVTLQMKDSGIIEKRPGSNQITVTTQEVVLKILIPSMSRQGKQEEISKILQQKGIKTEFQIAIELGKPFKDYGLIDNVLDQSKTQLLHQNNQVLLLNVWATWCGPCQKPMQNNQQMLQKNQQNWKGKVRFVSVSVDDTKEVVRERVTRKGWLRSTQLTLLGWRDDHPLIQDYKVTGVPFFCLVNKWGKVDFLGHPSQINLQNRINELILQTSDPSLNQVPSTEVASSKYKSKQIEYAQRLMKCLSQQEMEKHFQGVDLVVMMYEHKNTFKKRIQKHTFLAQAYIIDGDELAQQKLQSMFIKNQNLQININKVKYYSIPQVEHPQCFICLQKNLQYPYYWMKWEQQNTFGCRACVERKSTIAGHHYFYQKNSILLCGPWSKVAHKDVGANIQPTNPQSAYNDHFYSCNGCGGGSNGIGSARYISLGSRADPSFSQNGNVDLCEQCIQKFIKRDELIIEALAQQRYSPNHPFLRVLYNVNGYYNY